MMRFVVKSVIMGCDVFYSARSVSFFVGLIDTQSLFEAGDGKLFFIGGWAGWGEGVPSSGVSFLIEFFGRVDHGDVFTDVEHREVCMAV